MSRDNYGQATPPAQGRGARFVAIAAGSNHGLALRADGSLTGWGLNDDGQATPPAGNDFVAIAAGGNHSWGIKYSCPYVLGGDSNDDCAVNFSDCLMMGANWLINVDFFDFAEMAANWQIDCSATPENPACVPK